MRTEIYEIGYAEAYPEDKPVEKVLWSGDMDLVSESCRVMDIQIDGTWYEHEESCIVIPKGLPPLQRIQVERK